MKRLFPRILIAILVVLLLVAFVACNDKNNNNQDDDEPNQYEVATYSVTFNANSDLVDFSSYNLTDVETGTYIQKPKKSNGEEARPVKTGYTFLFWYSTDPTAAFDFENTPIDSDLTLTAQYSPKRYTHTVDITAKLVQSTDSSGNVTYTVESGVYSKGSMPEDPMLTSTYNSTVGSLSVPTSSDPADKFMFWYYMQDGRPVRFSSIAADVTASEVSQITSYTFTKPLQLYAMWYSQLPKISVVFKDSLSDKVYGSHDYAQTDYVDLGFAPNMMDAENLKAGYVFDKWYYLKRVDGVESDTEVDFVFAADDEENPTSLTTATGIDDVFESGTLNLYASWKKLVSIANKADFDDIYDIMHDENSTEDAKQEIMNAYIKIADDINLGTAEYAPLFDSEHRFAGEIDGGLYDGEGNLTNKFTVSGGVFGDSTSASVFGYISGVVKNLDFENIGLKFAVPNTSGTAFVAGAIASVSSANINNCEVNFDSVSINLDGATVESGYIKNGLASVVFGGLVGRNVGGEIKEVKVVIASVDALSESLIFGGIAGENTASGSVNNVDVEVVIANVRCYDNNKTGDGLSFAKIGGLIGTNGGTVLQAEIQLTLTSLTCENGFEFGGVSASGTGGIEKTHAVASLATQVVPALVGGYANIGGLVGKNEGHISSSYAETNLYVLSNTMGDTIMVGGLIGNNYSLRSDSTIGENALGAVNKSYATGVISIRAAEEATVYAGGLMGRNNRSNIASDFAIVDISVENAGESSLGKLFGSSEQNANVTSIWYAEETTITLNGEATTGLIKGTQTARANFEDETFVIGTSSEVKFDSTVWKIEGGLPELK